MTEDRPSFLGRHPWVLVVVALLLSLAGGITTLLIATANPP